MVQEVGSRTSFQQDTQRTT